MMDTSRQNFGKAATTVLLVRPGEPHPQNWE